MPFVRCRSTPLIFAVDPIITPEVFAQSIVDDYSLAPSYHVVITKAIQDQLSDFKAHSTTFGEDGVVIASDTNDIQMGKLEGQDAEWWETWRKNVISGAVYKQSSTRSDTRSRKRRKLVKEEAVDLATLRGPDAPMIVDDFDEDESFLNEDMRILVKVSRRVSWASSPNMYASVARHRRRISEARGSV